MRFIDISMSLSADTPCYPGDPKLSVKTRRKGGVAASRVSMSLHAGTHVDAPAHYVAGGKTLHEVGLERLNGRCKVLDLSAADGRITPRMLSGSGVRSGDIVLLKTRNSRGLRDAFDKAYVTPTPDAALWLSHKGVKAVGVDGLSVDPVGEDTNHKILLKAGIPVIEGLDLSLAGNGGYTLICMPLRFLGAEASPARCVLVR
jgi:arylformamidase